MTDPFNPDHIFEQLAKHMAYPECQLVDALIIARCKRLIRELSASPGDGDAKEPSPPERAGMDYFISDEAIATEANRLARLPKHEQADAIDRSIRTARDRAFAQSEKASPPSPDPVVSKMEIADAWPTVEEWEALEFVVSIASDRDRYTGLAWAALHKLAAMRDGERKG